LFSFYKKTKYVYKWKQNLLKPNTDADTQSIHYPHMPTTPHTGNEIFDYFEWAKYPVTVSIPVAWCDPPWGA